MFYFASLVRAVVLNLVGSTKSRVSSVHSLNLTELEEYM